MQAIEEHGRCGFVWEGWDAPDEFLLVMAVASLARAESPFVAELAAFSGRYQEDPPHLDMIRAGLETAVKTDPDLSNLLALAQVCFLWGDIRACTLDRKLAAYDEGRRAGQRAVELAPKNPRPTFGTPSTWRAGARAR
jgi:hypothetical protein